MKRIILNIIFLLGLVNIASAQDIISESSQYDAEILLSETHEKFEFQKSNGLRQITRIQKITRKVKVLTDKGIDHYNKLHIPTYEDLGFKYILTDLEAKTVKASGQKISVKKDDIKETTLPANNSYFSDYKGKVKLIPFRQVNKGDIIEYSYTLKYMSSTARKWIARRYAQSIKQSVPVKEYVYSITVPNDNKFDLTTKNLDANFTKTKLDRGVKHTLKLKNLDANLDEPYDIDLTTQPMFWYWVTNYRQGNSDSWDDLVDRVVEKPKYSNFFTKRLLNLDERLQIKQQPSILEKVRMINDSIYDKTRNKGGKYRSLYYDMAWTNSTSYSSLNPNYFNFNTYASRIFTSYGQNGGIFGANIYMQLLKKMKIDASLILLKSKYDGFLNQNYLGAEQFDDFLVEIVDEQGQKHYVQIMNPFAAIDEIPAQYEGTKGVRIKEFRDGSDTELIDIPFSSADKNLRSLEKLVKLKMEADTLVQVVSEEHMYTGIYDDELRPFILALKENMDLRKDNYYVVKNFRKSGRSIHHVNASAGECIVNDGVYKAKLSYEEPLFSPRENITIPIVQLVPEAFRNQIIRNHDYQRNRKEEAHLFNAYTDNIKLEIKAPEGYKLIMNDLLKTSESCEFGSFSSEVSQSGDGGNFEITYTLNKSLCSASDWITLLDFDRKYKQLMSTEIALIKL